MRMCGAMIGGKRALMREYGNVEMVALSLFVTLVHVQPVNCDTVYFVFNRCPLSRRRD